VARLVRMLAVCSYGVALTTTSLFGATLTADLEFSQGMVSGTVTRCICFRLFDCARLPTEICIDVAFTGGMANDVSLPVPDRAFQCVEARDPLHTLRSISLVESVGRDFGAGFSGDPEDGGNWLILGNLNDDVRIDVLDVGTYKFEITQGSVYPNPDTTCGTNSPHADINGDGLVSGADLYHIAVANFLQTAKLGCWEQVCDCLDPKIDTDGDGVPDCIDVCPDINDQLFAPECATGIPATSEWGLIVLSLCLLVAGKVHFGGRSVVTTQH